jgi:hypothetical protein
MIPSTRLNPPPRRGVSRQKLAKRACALAGMLHARAARRRATSQATRRHEKVLPIPCCVTWLPSWLGVSSLRARYAIARADGGQSRPRSLLILHREVCLRWSLSSGGPVSAYTPLTLCCHCQCPCDLRCRLLRPLLEKVYLIHSVRYLFACLRPALAHTPIP